MLVTVSTHASGGTYYRLELGGQVFEFDDLQCPAMAEAISKAVATLPGKYTSGRYFDHWVYELPPMIVVAA
jgi:hypothetical protein